MARKTKKRKSGTRVRRRGRVGAIALPKQDEIMTGLGVVAGVVAVSMINDQLSKMTTPPDPKLVAFGELVVGFVGPKLLGKSNPLLTGVGYGMIGAAGVNLAKDFGMISGVPIISGYSQMKAINGMPPMIQNFTPAPAAPAGRGASVSQIISGITSSYHNYEA